MIYSPAAETFDLVVEAWDEAKRLTDANNNGVRPVRSLRNILAPSEKALDRMAKTTGGAESSSSNEAERRIRDLRSFQQEIMRAHSSDRGMKGNNFKV